MKNILGKRMVCLLKYHSQLLFALFKVFCLFFLLNLFILASASASNVLQDVKISVQQKNASIVKILDDIEQKTGYSILVRDSDIDIKAKVTVDMKNKSLSQILAAVFQGTGVRCDIIGKTISVYRPATVERNHFPPTCQITGVVKDNLGEPLMGANIIEKGTASNGTITDIDGKYTISVTPNATLIVSYIGFKAQEIPVGSRSQLNINLPTEEEVLDEVVVIGYTTQRTDLLAGSVVSVNIKKNLEKMPTVSVANLLVGKFAGVNVSTAKGIPGTNPDLRIRTESSWNDQPPLFVIDGVVRGNEGIVNNVALGSIDFNNLSPNEIESITILKDASSAAIYGSRSTGGVVLVTTKRGKEGKPVFNYSYSFGLDSRTKNLDMTSAVQTGELYTRINGSADPAGWAWSHEELEHYKTINNGWGYDQLGTVWRNPSIQTHNLSVNGGAEKVRYFGGVSYIRQQSFLESLSYDKLNFRLNATFDVTRNLQLFAGMALSDNKQSSDVWGDAEDVYAKLLRWQPDQPVFTDGGQLVDYGWKANVGGCVNGAGGYKTDKNLIPQVVLTATYQIPFLEGLKAKATYGSNWSYERNSEYRTIYDMAILKKGGANNRIVYTDDASVVGYRKSYDIPEDRLVKKVNWGFDYQLNFQLNYNRTFHKLHTVQGALVFEKAEWSDGQVYGGREAFPVYMTDQFWAGSDSRIDSWAGGEAETKNGRISYVGQFNYSYADKWLLNFSFREDGSMKFASGQRWGFFPAGAMGWIISEEPFFNTKTINHLKLRASIGLTGNDAVGGWLWRNSYESGRNSYFGTNPIQSPGIRYGAVANPRLTWEKSLSYNLGTDIKIWRHWNATAEYWFRKTYDILGDRGASVPTSYGRKVPKENYGQVNAQGFDLSIGYNNQFGEFDFHGNLTLSYGWNNVVIEDYAENAKWIDIPVGKSRKNLKGYRFDRILRTQEQLDTFNEEHPGYRIGSQTPALGMMVYKDLSGPAGKPDNIIDSWDRDVLVANNFPLIYGLNLGADWKGFSLDMMFNGKLHEQKSFKNLAEGVEWNRMWTAWYDNSWTPENTESWLPKRVSNSQSNTYTEDSDFWLKKVRFLRLKYLSLGYTIPKPFRGSFFDRVKLFFYGTNLFVVSNFSYYDPEMDGGYDFPAMRSYNFGIDVTF